MSELKKQCLVCKKEFIPCSSCDSLKVFFKDESYQWRKIVCCPEHFWYHYPIIEYVNGKITKYEAKELLVSAISKFGEIDFNDNVKAVVEEILQEDKIKNEVNCSHTKSNKKYKK